MNRPEEIDRINLTYSDHALIGRVRNTARHVLLMLDATDGAFSVLLPSAKDLRNIIFIMKKVDEVATAVTFTAQNGEYIHDSGAKGTSLVITGAAPVNMVSDAVDTWLIAG